MARDSEFERKYYARLARAAEWLDGVLEGKGLDGLDEGVCTEVRMRLGGSGDGDVLLIVKAYDDRGKWIAFVGALGPVDALLTWRSKCAGKGLKWREDLPWGGREQ